MEKVIDSVHLTYHWRVFHSKDWPTSQLKISGNRSIHQAVSIHSSIGLSFRSSEQLARRRMSTRDVGHRREVVCFHRIIPQIKRAVSQTSDVNERFSDRTPCSSSFWASQLECSAVNTRRWTSTRGRLQRYVITLDIWHHMCERPPTLSTWGSGLSIEGKGHQ